MLDDGIASVVGGGVADVVGGGIVYGLTRMVKERHQRRRLRRGHVAAVSGTLHGPGIPKRSLNTKIVIATHTLTGVEQIFGGGGARYEVLRPQIRNVRFDVRKPSDDQGLTVFTKVLTFETDAGLFTLNYDPLWDRLLRAALPDGSHGVGHVG